MENEAEKSPNGYEPKVVAFACQYCAYSAADLAGPTGLQYPANVRLVKLPCTGKLDVLYILDAFENGADAVFIAGCLDGNCHHVEGPLRAKRRLVLANKILNELGIGADRLGMYQMSGGESIRFVEAAREMTDRARQLGPSPLNQRKSAANE
ncbi:MAG: hydrogenase iron-sulfur subunit [Chloroflexi bacterium]|nr:hydrogenase iron-sulfur subunit [Chloroflexota bacterium]